MLILPRKSVEKLVKTGLVDVWAPQRTVRVCETCAGRIVRKRDPAGEKRSDRLPPRCERCHRWTKGKAVVLHPATNVIHLVRTKSHRETVARVSASSTRAGVLQDLTYEDALAAGFSTRDDLWDHFRLKYATGPLVNEPVGCWVTSYALIAERPSDHLLTNPIPGHSGDYTSSFHRTIDREAEGLEPDDLVRLSRDNRARWADMKRDDILAQLATCGTDQERLEMLRGIGKDCGVDVRSHIRAAERRILQEIERRSRAA